MLSAARAWQSGQLMPASVPGLFMEASSNQRLSHVACLAMAALGIKATDCQNAPRAEAGACYPTQVLSSW